MTRRRSIDDRRRCETAVDAVPKSPKCRAPTRADAVDGERLPRPPSGDARASPTSTRCSPRIRAGQVEATIEPDAGRPAPPSPTRARRRGGAASRRAAAEAEAEPSAEASDDRARSGRRARRPTSVATSGGRAGPRSSIRCSVPSPSGPSAPPRTIRTRCSTRCAGTRAGRPPRRCSCPKPSCARRGAVSCATRSTRPTAPGGVAVGRRAGRCRRRARRRSGRRRSCMPLRERIAAAIDTGEDGDTGGLVERIGARFREWKNQSLEDTLEDVLGVGVVAGRLRRLARGCGAALDPRGRRPLRRLRRQRTRADREGLDVSRPASSTRPLIAGAAACSRLPTRNIARCGSPRWKSDVVPSEFAAG